MRNFGVDDEALAGWHPNSEVGHLIRVPVAKASIEGIPVSWKQSPNVLQTPDLELMGPPQHLQTDSSSQRSSRRCHMMTKAFDTNLW